MNNTRNADENILLAYLRGELDAAEEQMLAERLRDEPELREELAWLEDIKTRFLLEDFDAHEDELFAQLQQQMSAAAPAQEHAQEHAVMPSMRQRMIDWFRSHALMLEGALAVLVIAQAVTLVSFLNSPAPVGSKPPVYRGAGDNCLTVSVRFRAGVTEQQIARWLGRYDASIHAGPDPQGRYRIVLPSRDALRGFLSDPDKPALAGSSALPPGCEPSG